MKKLSYLIALAMMAFTFTSCEDVPSPFGTIQAPKTNEEVSFEAAGTGTLADPFNVQGVLEYVAGLGADVQSDKEVYVKGFVTAIKEQFSAQYGNAQFTMSDSKDGGNSFTFYRGLYLGNKKWADGDATLSEGDEVIICGKVVNYKGSTPETVQNGAYIYSLNGKSEGGGGGGGTSTETIGTKDAPISISEALTKINALEDGKESTEFAYVKGKVVKVTTTQANFEKYGNLNYLISEDGTDNGSTITVYSGDGLDGAKFTSITDLAQGDEVIVYGKLYKYVKDSKVTPEIAKGNYLVSLVKGSGGGGGGGTTTGEAAGTGTQADPFNVAAAIAKCQEAGETATNDIFYVKGIVNAEYTVDSYKNATLVLVDTEGSDAKFTAFRVKGADGANLKEGYTIPKGATVIVSGKLVNYKGNTPETAQNSGTLISVNGQAPELDGDSGQGGGGDTQTNNHGTAEAPITVAQAIALIDAESNISEAYVKGIISKIDSYNATYKSITYWISDDGTTTTQLQVYSGKGLNGADFSSKEDLTVGKKVVIKGALKKYNTTYEFDKTSSIISIE